MKKNLKKLKRFIAVAMAVSMLLVGQAQAISVSQSDLYTDDNARYILTLKEHGVYDGFTDVQLSSREYIKTEEMITLFVKYLDKVPELSLDKIPSIYGEQEGKIETAETAEVTDNKGKKKDDSKEDENQDKEKLEIKKSDEQNEEDDQSKIVDNDSVKTSKQDQTKGDETENKDSQETHPDIDAQSKESGQVKEEKESLSQDDNNIQDKKDKPNQEIDLNTFELTEEGKKSYCAKHVETLVNKGLSGFFTGGVKEFSPYDIPQKRDFAFLMYSYLDAMGMIKKGVQDFTITDIENSPYKEVIRTVVGNKFMGVNSKGGFEPDKKLTRADFARLLCDYAKWEPAELPPIVPQYTVLDVPYISQLTPVYAPIGCEPTSVYQALKYKGYVNGVSQRYFMNNLPFDNINPNRGFVGHWSGWGNRAKRETIFPNALAAYAQRYAGQNAQDFSGHTPEDIQREIYMGNPVVVYLTWGLASPIYTTYYVEGKTYRWISNNHVVTVIGYNPNNGSYYVSDPFSYSTKKYWISKGTFEWLYNLRRHAIVVR